MRMRAADDAEVGKLLDELRQRDLETLIPKNLGAVVMVVRGKHRFRRGKLLERDSRRSEALVQLMGEPTAVTFSYDDVCEYVGERQAEDW